MDASRLLGLEAWQRRQGLTMFAVLAFAAIAAGAVAAGVLVAWLSQWSFLGIGCAVVLGLSIVGTTSAIIISKALRPPDFLTSHGVAFWTDGITEISESLMERALDRFISVMALEHPEIGQTELRNLLSKTGIEWKRGKVSILVGRHHLKHKDGIQHNYRILLRWKNSVAESAFFHELLHEVNQFIRLPRINGKAARDHFYAQNMRHEEVAWWELEDRMSIDFRD